LADQKQFKGDLNGENGHDDLAREIAENGKNWSTDYWRYEDQVAFTFRLYLEWGRLQAPRGADVDFAYHPKMEVRPEY